MRSEAHQSGNVLYLKHDRSENRSLHSHERHEAAEQQSYPLRPREPLVEAVYHRDEVVVDHDEQFQRLLDPPLS